jgi:plasmid stabilization system protein ParE
VLVDAVNDELVGAFGGPRVPEGVQVARQDGLSSTDPFVLDHREGQHAVGSHTLYYRIASADLIDVVRILHQRMDVDQHLD